jgi:methionyl-tRNA formyltransferase
MKIFILTSAKESGSSYFVQQLLVSGIEISAIIYNQNNAVKAKKFYFKKLKKALRIGLLGTYNGFRMRKWFGENVEKYFHVDPLPKIAEKYAIPYREVASINDAETAVIITALGVDLGISLGNGYISNKIFSIPNKGMINLHGEILPQYQNAQSIIWQLYNNSSETGFTIHKINRYIDKGDILYQQKMPIIFKKSLAETIAFNCAEIRKQSCLALIKVLNDFDFYSDNAKPQGQGVKYTTPSWKQFKRISKNYKKFAV